MALQDTVLTVTIHDGEGEETIFDDISYVSLVSPETYGKPALIAPSHDGKQAELGEKVLYINTRLVPYFEIVRNAS